MVEHCARPMSYGVWTYGMHAMGKMQQKSSLPLARASHNSKKFQIASWVPGWKKVFASGKLPLPFFISRAMNNNFPPDSAHLLRHRRLHWVFRQPARRPRRHLQQADAKHHQPGKKDHDVATYTESTRRLRPQVIGCYNLCPPPLPPNAEVMQA